MDATEMATFVLNNHGALDIDELDFLINCKGRFYWGSPTCVQDLHELTILYHEAVGFQKCLKKYGGAK